MPKMQDEKCKVLYSDDALTEVPEDTTFSIGQSYQDVAATTLICKFCQGSTFNIGQGSYFTAVKCVQCGQQSCVHDG